MNTAKGAEALLAKLKAAEASKAEIIRSLAEYCLGWPYVYAAAGELCSPEWRRNRMGYSDEKYAKAIKDACPVMNSSAVSCGGCKWDGCRCFDCRGFTRWLLSQAGLTLAGGGATTQWETASNWAAKGETKSMPKDLVCCVFKKRESKMSHTGMSMGDGNGGVIHCSTTVKRGNISTDTPQWTHWAIPAGLYTDDELRKAGVNVESSQNIPTLRKGSQGEAVEELQALLNAKYGANLEIDGHFGAKTEAAVKAFQTARGLAPDGVVGAKTRKALGKEACGEENSEQNADVTAGDASTPDNTNDPSDPCVLPRLTLMEMRAALGNCLSVINQVLEGNNHGNQ